MKVDLKIGGRKLTFSALNLGEIRALQSTLSQIMNSNLSGFEPVLVFVPHIFASVRKVHQDITQEQLEALLEVTDVPRAQRAMLEASGLKVPEPGEARPVAE